MTQKDKIMRAVMFAQRVRSIANSLEANMKSFDCSWPKIDIDALKYESEAFLKLM